MDVGGEVYSYKYDDTGKLIESKTSVEVDFWGHVLITSKYMWNDDMIRDSCSIIHTHSNEFIDKMTNGYVLDKNLVRHLNDDISYTYDESNRLVRYEDLTDLLSIIWDGDKLIKMSFPLDITFTYNDHSCKKGYNPFILFLSGWDLMGLPLAHPELFGMRTSQLPKTVKFGADTLSFTYEFDKDGYITKILGKFGGEVTMTCALTWE